MTIKLSYILPIYNVERYLIDCLDSIYAQNIPEESFEVICVNDCSPDCSRELVLEYQKKHRNMLLVDHATNRGLSFARNTGLSVAKGKYIWFVDSDDILISNIATQLLEYSIQNVLDILLFNYNEIEEDGSIIRFNNVFENTQPSNGLDFIRNKWGGDFVYHMGYVWRCICRREFLLSNDLYFPEGEYWEDTVYFPKALLLANRVSSLDIVGYSYRHNLTSISGGGKVMSAQKIYDFCFKAGGGLISFADEIKDSTLSIAMKSFAEKRYINSLLLKLLYASPNEVYCFAELCTKNRKSLLSELSQYFNFITKHIVRYPYFMGTLVLVARQLWRLIKLIQK